MKKNIQKLVIGLLLIQLTLWVNATFCLENHCLLLTQNSHQADFLINDDPYNDSHNYKLNRSSIDNNRANNFSIDRNLKMNALTHKISPVKKTVLKNGMTVLVYPMHNVPKVTLQMWYNVGSKDEKSGEKGIAHLIEHMIFKGTQKLSESDINIVAQMLSGSINAFTSYDYTGYLFNMPTQHWHEVLPIMADCMTNAGFNDDHLNSEMKAVIQELKMYKDNYFMSMVEQLLSCIFADHPYHYPIIGFKQDLWTVRGKDLQKFYKQHYAPNNATLVVVGDVDPQDVVEQAERYFGHIPANPHYKKEVFYHNQDISSKTVTLYREVQQPVVALVYVTPGTSNGKEYLLEIASFILGAGKSSRLHKILVDQMHLVTDISASYWDLFEHGLFFISYEPKDIADCAKIEGIIEEEIASIINDGISEKELSSALKKAQMKLYSILEKTEKHAYEIGKYYLATGDENYIYNCLNVDLKQLEADIRQLCANYFKNVVMHKGFVLPLPEYEKSFAAQLQKKSDKEDQQILSARIRETELEGANYAKNVKPAQPKQFDFPKSKEFTLANGLKVLYYHNPNNLPKINLSLELKARWYYDSAELPGLYNFVAHMMTEGTNKHNAVELAEEIESRGMSFAAAPGGVYMSMLSSDLEYGLELAREMLTSATFQEDEIEKVREQIISDIKNFWDEPTSFAGLLVKQQVYKNHPYNKNDLGTLESVKKISRNDLVEFYKKYISPQQATIAIVGDLTGYDLQNVLEKTLGKWQGPKIEQIEFPALAKVHAQEVNYPINRDQVVLAFAGLSVKRTDPDYEKLVLFDQLFGSGALGSLNSRLFQLREQSGLFYTINGSLTSGSDEQPGMFFVKTIVSLDRLKEAENAIKNTIKTVVDTIKPEEMDEARNAVVNAMTNNFESNNKIAQAFLFLDRFNLPKDYFDNRANQLKKIDLAQMKEAVNKVLKVENMVTVRVGRVDIVEPK